MNEDQQEQGQDQTPTLNEQQLSDWEQWDAEEWEKFIKGQ
jgi:hypothetical protein